MLRRISYKVVNIMYKLAISVIHFTQNLLNVTHNYQPNPFKSLDKSGRDTLDRYASFMSVIDSHPDSLIDLGCNRGFFVLKSASQGTFSMGVDHDWYEILYAKSVADINNVAHAAFVNSEINIDFIRKIPSFDAVICTSIFHHWVRVYGKDKAFKMMELVANKTNKYLLFETGQYNEVETKWFENLEFMGDDSEQWIEDFLLNLGFSSVVRSGKFDSNLSDVKRTLYIAIK